MPARLTWSGRSDIVQQLTLRGSALADDSISKDYSDLSALIGSDKYHKFMMQRPIIQDIYTTDSKVGTSLLALIRMLKVHAATNLMCLQYLYPQKCLLMNNSKVCGN